MIRCKVFIALTFLLLIQQGIAGSIQSTCQSKDINISIAIHANDSHDKLLSEHKHTDVVTPALTTLSDSGHNGHGQAMADCEHCDDNCCQNCQCSSLSMYCMNGYIAVNHSRSIGNESREFHIILISPFTPYRPPIIS